MGYERVQYVIALLWKWLATLKREQARRALAAARDAFRAAPGRSRDRATCKRGHSLEDPTNVYTYYQHGYKSRGCRECGRIKMREHRQRKLARALLVAV